MSSGVETDGCLWPGAPRPNGAGCIRHTITSIVEGVSGGSAAHIVRHAAPAPAAPAPDTGSAAAGSSSSHAALPAPTAATTAGFTATAPRAAGERTTLRQSRGRARTNTLRRQADASPPQGATTPQKTSAAKGAVATSSGAATRAFLRLGGWGAVPLAATVAAAAGVRARKRMRADEVSGSQGGRVWSSGDTLGRWQGRHLPIRSQMRGASQSVGHTWLYRKG